MDDNKHIDNILFYLDNELGEQERLNFIAHLKECSQCMAIYEEVALTYKVIGVENKFEGSPFFYHQLKTRLEAKDDKQAVGIFSLVLKPLAIAASITLGIMIGNGELNLLNITLDDSEIASEEFTPVLPADYSLWVTMNEDNGSEN